MQWLLGFTPASDERACLLLVSPGGTAFLMPALNADDVRQHTDIDFVPWADDVGPHVALCQALSGIGASAPERVAIDETMRADFALLVLDALPSDVLRTFTADTPSKRPTCFSILATHEGQEKPSARRTVRVEEAFVVMIIIPFDDGSARSWAGTHDATNGPAGSP